MNFIFVLQKEEKSCRCFKRFNKVCFYIDVADWRFHVLIGISCLYVAPLRRPHHLETRQLFLQYQRSQGDTWRKRDRRRVKENTWIIALRLQTALETSFSSLKFMQCTPLTYIITVHQRTLSAIHLKALMSHPKKPCHNLYSLVLFLANCH